MIVAVKQVEERGHNVAVVAARLMGRVQFIGGNSTPYGRRTLASSRRLLRRYVNTRGQIR